jgi:lipoate-protein ligase A
MAVDEALLEFVAQWNQPVLRFYGWTEPAATFGYSQRYADIARWTALRPLVRRPTGGGLVPHDADWTYSLAFPPLHSWYHLKAVESYKAVHEWLARAFSALGVSTRLAPTALATAPGQCFAGAERFDLLLQDAKIAGAAQRRNRSGLLIQGSVQPRGTSWNRSEWEKAMLNAAPGAPELVWRELPPDVSFQDRVDQLAAEKYSRDQYNQRR